MRFLDSRIIGHPGCPLFHRTTLVEVRDYALKLHRFYPNADDRDAHDHPWDFYTFVLRGGYDDMALCNWCDGLDTAALPVGQRCEVCDGGGYLVRDRLRARAFRRRSAEHVHRTRVHEDGCASLVFTLPARRRWGFYRDGRWWAWRRYEEKFGPGMRCIDE